MKVEIYPINLNTMDVEVKLKMRYGQLVELLNFINSGTSPDTYLHNQIKIAAGNFISQLSTYQTIRNPKEDEDL